MPVSGIPLAQLKFPLVIKPAWEGSSKGIRGKCVVETPEELAAAQFVGRPAQQHLDTTEFRPSDAGFQPFVPHPF